MLSLGVLIGAPIAITLLVGSIICAALFKKKMKKTVNSFDRGNLKFGLIISLIAAVLTLGASALAYFPYQMQYHSWQTVSGTVTQVGNRIASGDKTVDQKFVLLINGQEYGCAETRCSLVQPGDTVTLQCKRTWQYAGEDGYDCEFVRRTPAAAK